MIRAADTGAAPVAAFPTGRMPHSASEPSLTQHHQRSVSAAAAAAAGSDGESRGGSPAPGQHSSSGGGGGRRVDGGWAVPEAQEVAAPRGFVAPAAVQATAFPSFAPAPPRPAAPPSSRGQTLAFKSLCHLSLPEVTVSSVRSMFPTDAWWMRCKILRTLSGAAPSQDGSVSFSVSVSVSISVFERLWSFEP